MIELIPFDADHVVGVRIEGRIDESEFDGLISTVEKRLQRNDKLDIYVEMASFAGMSAQTLLKDLRFGFSHWKHFRKEAVVTEKGWVSTLAPAVAALFPGLEVKVFAADEKAAAQRWLMS